VKEKSQGGIEIVVLFESGNGTDPTHPVAGKLYSGCSTVFTAAGLAARFRICPAIDGTSAPNGRGKLAVGWMGGIATALPGFKVESCSGAGFRLGVVPGTDWTPTPNGRGKLLAVGCWMGGIATVTALPGFEVESCSGAGFGVIPGTDWTSAPNGFRVVPGTDWTSNGKGKLLAVGCWMGGIATVTALPGFEVESCSGAGFGVIPGTDWTSAPNGRRKLAGGCWMGGITTALPGFKVESCGGACDSESMAGPSSPWACGVTVGSKLEDVEVDSVESSFMEFSSRSSLVTLLVVIPVVALGPSFFVSRFKARRIRSSGA
jgi:hypothetical protein